MQPRIETLKEKKLVGIRCNMSFLENKTRSLWQSFMPRRNEIDHKTGQDLFSVEVYDPLFFQPFDIKKEFEKWAAIEVSVLNTIPDKMKLLIIPGGLYAVFLYRGPASEAEKTYRDIFMNWLPGSGYLLDNRPHFALMGEKYKHEDPASEEEIWIPVKQKTQA